MLRRLHFEKYSGWIWYRDARPGPRMQVMRSRTGKWVGRSRGRSFVLLRYRYEAFNYLEPGATIRPYYRPTFRRGPRWIAFIWMQRVWEFRWRQNPLRMPKRPRALPLPQVPPADPGETE